MKTRILAFSTALTLGLSVLAAPPAAPAAAPAGAALSGLIVKKDGKQVKADTITDVDATGTVTYKEGNFTSKLKPGEYNYIRLTKTPQEITDAEKKVKDGKFEDAIGDFRKLFSSKYKFLGYDMTCLYWEAFCLDKLNKKGEAVEVLKKFEGMDPKDKKQEVEFFNAKKLLSSIYIDQNKFDDAYPVLTELGNTEDDNLAAYSFNARGEILKKQGKKKDAVLMYMRTALLFPKKNTERADSLINISNLLKEMNDNRGTKFAEILKKDYPEKAGDLK